MQNTGGSPVPQLTPGQPRQMLGEAIQHVKMTGTLLNCDEAIRFIEQIRDPVTRNLVNMAFVHLVKRVHLEKRDPPQADLEMLFIVTFLQDFFAEHDVTARTLEGEKVARGLMACDLEWKQAPTPDCCPAKNHLGEIGQPRLLCATK